MGAASSWEGKEFVFTRVLTAPRALVWRAWTDSKHLAVWWGPNGFTNPVCELDLRPGGAIHIDMTAPDGTVYPMSGEVKEVAAPERLVFTSAALVDGKKIFDERNTVTFDEKDGKTVLTVRARITMTTAKAPDYLKGMDEGWNQTLDRLAAYLTKA
jgi:uncharacterized protein YndB with AHSA1/START domain